MYKFSEAQEVFLHTQFTDFRKPINGLLGIVEADLARDAYTGTLFVFCNKANDKLKILYWVYSLVQTLGKTQVQVVN